jgi:hypothetical protein
MACVASQSMTHGAAAKPVPVGACQLWSSALGPRRAIPGSVRLVSTWSARTEPASTLCAPGVHWRLARVACTGGQAVKSAVVAGVVVTSVMRVGVSSSQVAVPCTLSPVHAVARFVP